MEPDDKSNEVFENPEPEGIHSRGASFKSLNSYASFRSCRTYKSMGGVSSVSRSSYKSCVSKLNKDIGLDNPVFKDCYDEELTSMYSVTEGDFHSFSIHHPSERQLEKQREALGNSHVSGGGPDGGQTAESDEKPDSDTWSLYLAYFFSILAGIIFTASLVLINLVPSVNSWTLLLVRCGVQVLSMLPLIILQNISLLGPKGFRIRIYLQGIVSGVLLLGIFLSIQRLPLCDATTIFYTAPLFTLLLSSFILKEHFGILRLTVGALLLAGVILLCKPSLIFQQTIMKTSDNITSLSVIPSVPSDQHSYYEFNLLGYPLHFNESSKGAQFGLFTITHNAGHDIHEHGRSLDHNEDDITHKSADHSEDDITHKSADHSEYDITHKSADHSEDDISSVHTHVDAIGLVAAIAVPILSAYLVILTHQCKEVHYSVLVFYYAVGGLIVSIIGFTTVTDMKIDYQPQEWGLVVFIAVLGLIGNILMTKAVTLVAPGKVMVLRSFQLISSYILQLGVFTIHPQILDLVGVGLVLLSMILIAVESFFIRKFKLRFL